MDRLKRILCLFLALAFLLTAPGVMPVKTEANAAVADSGVLSLALLFATWAGVTFNQSDQAVTAMQNFLTTKAEVASTINSLIGKNIILGTTDLLLTGDLRAAFSIILPHVKSFFQTESETVSSSNSGYLCDSVVCGVRYPFITWESTDYKNFPFNIPNSPGHCFTVSYTYNGASCTYRDFFSENIDFFAVQYQPPSSSSQFGFFSLVSRAVSGGVSYGRWIECDSPGFVTFDFASDSIPFQTSKEVNGSASLGALESADLDESDKVYPIAPVTKVVSSGLAGSTTAPGLSAEEYEKILADVLATTAVIPTTPQPTTAEPEPTTATPDEEKVHPITPDILGGMFDGLKVWVEPLLKSILAAIQAIPEKIDSLFESLTAWWTQTIADIKAWCTQVIADVKAWIEVKIQTIADWWTTFWSETKALILSISAAITEFFTVTFPAWITDVKEWALALPKTLVDAIVLALTAVFVPAVGYWDAKVAALQAKFPLFNSILTTGKGFSGFFSGLGTRPPIIYIDLGSSASWAMGGRTIFLDLTWYSQYKPTMDLVIAGFLWLLFAWRFFLRLPGLLRGEVGTIDRLDSYLSEKRKKNGG